MGIISPALVVITLPINYLQLAQYFHAGLKIEQAAQENAFPVPPQLYMCEDGAAR